MRVGWNRAHHVWCCLPLERRQQCSTAWIHDYKAVMNQQCLGTTARFFNSTSFTSPRCALGDVGIPMAASVAAVGSSVCQGCASSWMMRFSSRLWPCSKYPPWLLVATAISVAMLGRRITFDTAVGWLSLVSLRSFTCSRSLSRKSRGHEHVLRVAPVPCRDWLRVSARARRLASLKRWASMVHGDSDCVDRTGPCWFGSRVALSNRNCALAC